MDRLTKFRRPKSGPKPPRINRILVPLDFSEKASESLHYAVAVAGATKAKITLIHVMEPAYVSSDPGLTYLPQQISDQEKSHESQMRKIAEKSIPKGLFDKAIVRSGVPYHEITTAAKKLKAGLIVVTTHGRTGLSHVLMGSTAERVVRHAHCPVLTIRRANGET